jgi:GTP-binding protein HflX
VPTVALVGYTNVGKSTLFNRLTAAGVLQADQLFATLDPTLRRLPLQGGRNAVLADTVGFISQLPHELVAAFRATLEETRSADLLLHVVDADPRERARHIQDVETVLAEIGAEAVPRIMVYNKIDALAALPGGPPEGPLRAQAPRVDRDAAGRIERVWVSAVTGAGLELLLDAIAERLQPAIARRRLLLGPEDGALRAWLFRNATIEHDSPTDLGGWDMEISMPQARWQRLQTGSDDISRRVCAIVGPTQAATRVARRAIEAAR